MAVRAQQSTLALEQLVGLLGSPGAARVLPTLIFAVEIDSGDSPEEVKVLVHLVKCRSNGFMVFLPVFAGALEVLDSLDLEGTRLEILFKEMTIDYEDAKGRKFGSGPAILADFPKEALPFFSLSSAVRGAAAKRLVRLNVSGTAARPSLRGAVSMASDWIAEFADMEEVMVEYLTAESGGERTEEEASEMANGSQPVAAEEDADLVARLLSRIEELEQQQVPRPSALRPSPAVRIDPQPKTIPPSTLFAGAPTAPGLDEATLAKLKSLAGPAPKRVAKQPSRLSVAETNVPAQDVFAELGSGATDDDELNQILGTSSDPLHRLLALQMKQTAVLTQRLVGAPRDRISAALGSEQGSSGGGVKGCVARDAYIKTMEDLAGTGQQIMANAASDLGVPLDQVTSGLMREFVERRIPLGEHRILTFVAHYMAVSWQVSFEEQNEVAMSLMARGLMMIEQMALDQGRCNFAWLLAAMPDPNLAMIQANRKRVGLKPYAKLASAPWVAGNVAYLKDLDYLENRLKGTKPPVKEEEETDESKIAKKPWLKKKKKNQGGDDPPAPAS